VRRTYGANVYEAFPSFPPNQKEKRKEKKRKQEGNGGHDVTEGRRVRERRNGDEQCGHE